MENLIKLYEKSFKENKELPAVTDYLTGKTYSYFQFAAQVDSRHRLFKSLNIEKGDKIALVGRNSIDWICTYISVITYGATIVPILADFNPIDMGNIIRHSDSKILFADKAILEKLDRNTVGGLLASYTLEDTPEPDYGHFDISRIKYADLDWEDLVVISYTSGTTGTSKGVMLPLRSLSNNVCFTITKKFHFRESRVLALLPLAHAYGCTFDMLTPLATGSHIHVLGKLPSPNVLLEALKSVKPHLLCTVPLVMEKIVKKSIFPKIGKAPVKTLLKLPVVKNIIYKKICQELLNSLGGCIMEVNMGGAALAPEVEKFLRRIHFPFMVGYGMTETGPLISYSGWRDFKPASCGMVIPGMEAKVDSEGYDKDMGEILVKGLNVMKGYYKNPEATDRVLSKDGWLRTGDVGMVSKHNVIYLRGRCKSMILTSAGQNIYPEEIESKLNNLDGVAESLVYEEKGRIFALVVPNADLLKENKNDYTPIKDLMRENLAILNTLVAPYEKVSEIKICIGAFEKTPKQSIKRFLYPKAATIIEL